MPPPPLPAWVFLRSHREATLSADGSIEKARFVIDGASGRIVLPVQPSILDAEELILFIPEEAPQSGPELQLLLIPHPLDPDSEPADRWKACHGEPRQPRWLSCDIDSGKFQGDIVEAADLQRENPLRAAEGRLCKRLNSDRPALAAACLRATTVSIPDPLAVGVDPTGIDLRARFGIVHVPFAQPAWTEPDATRAIDALLGGPA